MFNIEKASSVLYDSSGRITKIVVKDNMPWAYPEDVDSHTVTISYNNDSSISVSRFEGSKEVQHWDYQKDEMNNWIFDYSSNW
jgi:hypothetical protein